VAVAVVGGAGHAAVLWRGEPTSAKGFDVVALAVRSGLFAGGVEALAVADLEQPPQRTGEAPFAGDADLAFAFGEQDALDVGVVQPLAQC
jgi:hypothetical protein